MKSNAQFNPMHFEVVFLPSDIAVDFESQIEKGRRMVEEGRCVLFVPYRKSESGMPDM